MSSARSAPALPHPTARSIGASYLLTIASRMFVEIFVRNRFLVSGEGAATPDLPRSIGWLMMFAGFSYTSFVSPPLVEKLQPYILVSPAVGQISLTLWLLVMGVNAERWREQAVAARS